MFPTLFDSAWIGLEGALHFRIPTYFAAIMAGFLAGGFLTLRETERLGVSRQQYTDFLIWILIVGVFGARVFHVLFDGFFMDYVHLCTDPFLLEGKSLVTGDLCYANAQCFGEQTGGRDIGSICNVKDGLCYPMQDCFRAVKFWAGGLTVYGAIVATIPVSYWYFKRFKMPAGAILDMGGYGIPLGISIGRLGCLGAGCCFGGVCDIPAIAMRFPTGSSAYQHHYDNHFAELSLQWATGIQTSLPVWPTQLISASYTFLIFLLAYFVIRPRKRFHGQVLLFSVALYALFRFGVEFIRADPRGGVGEVSTSQIIAICTSMLCGYLYVTLSRKAGAKSSESAPQSEEEE